MHLNFCEDSVPHAKNKKHPPKQTKEQTKKNNLTLVGWLSWVESHPIHLKVSEFYPGQCTYLVVAGSISCWGIYRRQLINVSHQCFSLPFSFSKKLINISLGGYFFLILFRQNSINAIQWWFILELATKYI